MTSRLVPIALRIRMPSTLTSAGTARKAPLPPSAPSARPTTAPAARARMTALTRRCRFRRPCPPPAGPLPPSRASRRSRPRPPRREPPAVRRPAGNGWRSAGSRSGATPARERAAPRWPARTAAGARPGAHAPPVTRTARARPAARRHLRCRRRRHGRCEWPPPARLPGPGLPDLVGTYSFRVLAPHSHLGSADRRGAGSGGTSPPLQGFRTASPAFSAASKEVVDGDVAADGVQQGEAAMAARMPPAQCTHTSPSGTSWRRRLDRVDEEHEVLPSSEELPWGVYLER